MSKQTILGLVGYLFIGTAVVLMARPAPVDGPTAKVAKAPVNWPDDATRLSDDWLALSGWCGRGDFG